MVETPDEKSLIMTYAPNAQHSTSGAAPFTWSHDEWWDELVYNAM